MAHDFREPGSCLEFDCNVDFVVLRKGLHSLADPFRRFRYPSL
jgi:hypothetical protein